MHCFMYSYIASCNVMLVMHGFILSVLKLYHALKTQNSLFKFFRLDCSLGSQAIAIAFQYYCTIIATACSVSYLMHVYIYVHA